MGPVTSSESAVAVLAQASGGLGVPIRELGLLVLASAVITFLVTGIVRVLAIRFGALAIPRQRDVHVAPVPRLGGVGIYLGIIISFGLASQLPALTRGFEFGTDVVAVMLAGAVIVIVGAIDDMWGLDALTKFVGQVTAAGIMVVFGLIWFLLFLPWGGGVTVVLDQLQSGTLTVLVTVVMINAVNFIDGLDGLAAGVGVIAAAAVCLFSVSLLRDQGGDVSAYPPAMIAAALAGACLGFLPHNFHRARIFMGDSGSMLIGLMLAAASTSASGRIGLAAYGTKDLLALLSPVLVVGAIMFIPFLDLLLAVVRRTRAGRSPFSPDKMHLHHRLLQIGHSHRRVVLLLYLWTGSLAFLAVGPALMSVAVVAPIAVALFLVAIAATVVPRLSRRA